MKLHQAAQRLRLGGLREVEGRSTVADLLPAGRRTGIYILGFRTGEAYAGLSVDIVARFAQHARTHSDIVSFAAKAVPHRHLDVEETHVIERLERWGFRLRNIAKASIPSIESDLDAVLTVRDQERFVRTGTLRLTNLTTPLLRDLRRRYLRRFGELMARPKGLDATAGLALFLSHAIPAPSATQVSFWSSTAAPSARVHIRVNIHWQEVLTAYSQSNELYFSLHVAAALWPSRLGRVFARSSPAYRRLRFRRTDTRLAASIKLGLTYAAWRGLQPSFAHRALPRRRAFLMFDSCEKVHVVGAVITARNSLTLPSV